MDADPRSESGKQVPAQPESGRSPRGSGGGQGRKREAAFRWRLQTRGRKGGWTGSVGKGRIKPSREPPSGAEDFISPEQRSTFPELLQRFFNCLCVCVVSCCPVVFLFDVFLLRGARAWTRQLLPLRSAPLPPSCWPRLPAVENVSQLMTFICVSP